jgi:hypothetical protein
MCGQDGTRRRLGQATEIGQVIFASRGILRCGVLRDTHNSSLDSRSQPCLLIQRPRPRRSSSGRPEQKRSDYFSIQVEGAVATGDLAKPNVYVCAMICAYRASMPIRPGGWAVSCASIEPCDPFCRSTIAPHDGGTKPKRTVACGSNGRTLSASHQAGFSRLKASLLSS